MVVRSALAGLRIEEVPTTLKPDGRSRPPHLRTWRDGWRHLKFLLMYNPRWLFFIPGLTLCGLGVLLAALLFFGPLQLNTHHGARPQHLRCGLLHDGHRHAAAQLRRAVALLRPITGILPDTRGSDWLTGTISTDRLALNAGICFAGGVAVLRLCRAALGAARLRAAEQPGDPAHRRARPDADRDRRCRPSSRPSCSGCWRFRSSGMQSPAAPH